MHVAGPAYAEARAVGAALDADSVPQIVHGQDGLRDEHSAAVRSGSLVASSLSVVLNASRRHEGFVTGEGGEDRLFLRCDGFGYTLDEFRRHFPRTFHIPGSGRQADSQSAPADDFPNGTFKLRTEPVRFAGELSVQA